MVLFSQHVPIRAISATASWFCSTITLLNTSLSDFPHTWHLAQDFFFILFSIILFYINYSVVTSVQTLTDMHAEGGVWRDMLSLDLFGFALCFLLPRYSGGNTQESDKVVGQREKSKAICVIHSVEWESIIWNPTVQNFGGWHGNTGENEHIWVYVMDYIKNTGVPKQQQQNYTRLNLSYIHAFKGNNNELCI